MRIKTERQTIIDAVDRINKKYYVGNVNINWGTPKGKYQNVRLDTLSYKKPGYRTGFHVNNDGSPRKMKNACWHVHGHFFEEVLSIDPEAVIITGYDPKTNRQIKIYNGPCDVPFGNWIDRNIGSQFSPLYFSDACRCDLDFDMPEEWHEHKDYMIKITMEDKIIYVSTDCECPFKRDDTESLKDCIEISPKAFEDMKELCGAVTERDGSNPECFGVESGTCPIRDGIVTVKREGTQ